MPKSRIIRPQFFVNETIGDLPPLARLLYIGLWTIADRDGRLKDRVKTIKAQILPFNDCDVDGLINSLSTANLITRYGIKGGEKCIQIHNWKENQKIHPREKSLDLPTYQKAVKLSGSAGKCREMPGNLIHERVPLKVEVEVKEEVKTKAKVEVKTKAEISSFDDFWIAYPKKRGKGAALKAWGSIKPSKEEVEQILAAVAIQKQAPQWLQDGGQFIPYPKKWLTERRWLDEPETAYQQEFDQAKFRRSKAAARLELAKDLMAHAENGGKKHA